MRNKLFGAIGILWGGGIVFYRLSSHLGSTAPGYQAGANGAMIFGGLMLAAGLYYFFKKPA